MAKKRLFQPPLKRQRLALAPKSSQLRFVGYPQRALQKVPVFSLSSFLFEKHAVPVGIEPIVLPDCVLIRVKNIVFPAQCAYQHQERGLRQMEICQKGSNDAKLIARIDEQVR